VKEKLDSGKKSNGNVAKVLKWSGVSVGSFILAAAISFFFAVGCGVVPIAQDFWLETGMTTFHHHWVSEIVIPPVLIDEHRQMLDAQDEAQNSLKTDVNDINKDDFYVNGSDDEMSEEERSRQEEKKYAEEGYYKQSEGVYIKEITGTSTAGKYVGYLMLCPDPSRVKLVDTSRQYVCGEQVSSMIANSGAVAGINGGGFVDENYISNGGTPYGILIEDKELVCGHKSGYYRLIGMTESNVMVAGSYSGSEALGLGLRSAVTAEMILISNGNKQNVSGWGIAPRTALGQRKTGEVIFLVVDGRHPAHSAGCDLKDLADILYDEGCVNAAMVDGGASSVMETATYDSVGNCEVELVNRPDLGHDLPEDQRLDKQRWINNAWVIMPKAKNVVNSNEEAPHDGLIAK